MQVRAFEGTQEPFHSDTLPAHSGDCIDVTPEQNVSATQTNLPIDAAGSSQTRQLLAKEQPMHSKFCVAALLATLCVVGNFVFLAYILQ